MYTALIKKFKNDDQGRTTTFTQKKICPKKKICKMRIKTERKKSINRSCFWK